MRPDEDEAQAAVVQQCLISFFKLHEYETPESFENENTKRNLQILQISQTSSGTADVDAITKSPASTRGIGAWMSSWIKISPCS
jgi:hypothetical protein